jgi:DNA-binding transcriptional LysR family regulator
MALTAHGQLYYDESLSILDRIERVEDRLRSGAGAVRGALRINAPHSFAMAFLAPRLGGFLDRYPELDVTFAVDDRVVDMIEGGFDLSIRIRAELPDSGLVARRIAPVRQRLFAAPAYLDAHGAPTGPDALARHATIAYLLSDDPVHYELHGPGGVETVTLAPRLRLGSSLLLRDMLVEGRGVGALPDFISDPVEQSGALVRVLPEWELPRRHVYAVTASRLGSDAKALAFIDFLAEALPRHS